ncbi:hypothetical protein B0H10DRAFT_1952263 [Mycena sp. CBHHK59/15]|nr:hypothetical protein B0H10DRAFT_1952263 [Mycena sp. CBHHK59/15]
MSKLSKRPLHRILEMHKVVFDPLDGTAALRKHLKRYLRRLRHGKKLLDLSAARSSYKAASEAERVQELKKLHTEWPTLNTYATKVVVPRLTMTSLWLSEPHNM